MGRFRNLASDYDRLEMQCERDKQARAASEQEKEAAKSKIELVGSGKGEYLRH